MNTAEQRVEVARDVILRLTERKFKARRGTLLIFKDKNVPSEGDLQGYLQDNQSECEACARGALFMSMARLYNEMPLNKFERYPDDGGWGIRYHTDVNSRLDDIFSLRQIGMIECAFEKDADLNNTHAGWDDRLASEEFGRRYNTPRSRLMAIMTNIVENNREFVP